MEILPDLSSKPLFPELDWLNTTPQGGNIFYDGMSVTNLINNEVINDSGDFLNDVINSRINTSSAKILAEWQFQSSGALAMKTDENNGLWLSPTGLLGKKSGGTTFAIDTDGNATFAGTLSAASGTLGAITIGSNAWHVDSSGNMWWGNFSTYAAATYKISAAGVANLSGIVAASVAAENITAGTITGSTVVSNSSGARVILDASARALSIYKDSTKIGSFYVDSSDNDTKLQAHTDNLVFKVPSSQKFKWQINSTDEHIIWGDGDLQPGSNNNNKVGASTVSYAEMNAYSFVDHCLWLDEHDDLAILKATGPKKDKTGKIKRDKDGNAELDQYSLPEWLHNRRSIDEEREKRIKILQGNIKEIEDNLQIAGSKEKKILQISKEENQKELDRYVNMTEEEIVEMTGRNLGHFVDLVAGAVRQLDNKIDSLISLNKLKCSS